MLLVGGSNLAFGIDSLALHKEFGYHPVNLGLCAGLGLEFLLNECRDLMRRGDVVILSLEYPHFWSRQGGAVHIVPVLDHFPRAKMYIQDPRTWKRIEKFRNEAVVDPAPAADEGFLWLHKRIRRSLQSYAQEPPDWIYDRNGFNKYGDLTTHHGRKGRLDVEAACRRRYVLREGYPRLAFDQIAEFVDECQSQEVRVYLAHPPIPRTYWEHRKSDIRKIKSGIANELSVPIITNCEETIFEDHLFFDQVYHLTQEGKQMRTRQIIRKLKPLLKPLLKT